MATREDQINTTHLTQLMILNLGSRNACMRALVAHPTDLNAAANWLINHRNDANINTNPFQQQAAATTTNTTTTTTNTNFNRYTFNNNQQQQQQQQQQHSQQHMIQQVMNLGYTRDEALRAYTNVSTTDRTDTNKLVEYLVKNPKKTTDSKKSYNNTNSSYYPYSNSNKKKVQRPVINIDDIEIDKEEICDIKECECLEHIGIMLREYKKFIESVYEDKNNDNHLCEDGKDYEKNGFYAYFLSAISGDGEYTLSDVMDDFIHLITKHDVRYGEFNKLYKYMVGKEAMKGVLDKNVDLVKRINFCHDYYNKDINDDVMKEELFKKYYFGFKSIKEISTQQLMDKMYCYIVNSYDIAAKLNKDEYEKLDKVNGIKIDVEQKRDDDEKEKDISMLVKEKSIASYVGNKHYMQYAQLLDKQRINWFKSCTNDIKHAKMNKFYLSFNVKDLEKRIDPKELKAKLAKEKRERLREKKRREKEEADKLKAAQKKKEEEEQKEKEKEKGDEAEDDKAKEAENKDGDDKKPKEEEQEKGAEEAVKAEVVDDDDKKDGDKDKEVKKESTTEKKEENVVSGLDEKSEDTVNKSKVAPKVKEVEMIHVDKKEFSYGVRYNYWASDMEDLIGITIDKKQAKYENLKDELTKNEKCKISEFEYGLLNEKATIYHETEYCQENIEAGVNTFGIDILAKITKDHIIALMLYCNYDEMRNALCSTFIREPFDESNESMIERHSYFYWFGKLLRESIECFGIEAHKSETKVFYHGINMNKQIMSDEDIKSLFIYTPLSTTSSMEIALNNNSNHEDDNSLVLQLKGYVSKYFDCSWLSDLCYEKEQIFFGGTRALTVNKCIDYKFGYDHKLFIKAIKYIPNIFKSPISEWKINKNDDMLQETKEMIQNLIYHQLNKYGDNLKNNKYPDNLGINGIPKDIENELNEFCVNRNEVRMHYDAMYHHRAYGFLSSLFMTPTRTFTKLDIIDELFVNVNSISMVKVPLTTLTFFYLKSYINPPKPANVEEEKDDHKDNVDDNGNDKESKPCKCKIREIRLIDPKTAAMSIDQTIEAERKSLAEMQWIIESTDQVSLVLRYSETPVVIKEPTPTPPPQPAPVVVDDAAKAEGKKPLKKRPMKKRRKRPPQQKQKPKPKPKAEAKPAEYANEGQPADSKPAEKAEAANEPKQNT